MQNEGGETDALLPGTDEHGVHGRGGCLFRSNPLLHDCPLIAVTQIVNGFRFLVLLWLKTSVRKFADRRRGSSVTEKKYVVTVSILKIHFQIDISQVCT